jgi:enoyl-CoA hydratase/carnithine racemase
VQQRSAIPHSRDQWWCDVVLSHPVPGPVQQDPPGIRLDLKGEVARVCFDRPPVNALTVDMFLMLRAVLAREVESPRPVLLTGANGRFSAGFDVKQPLLDEAAAAEEARGCIAAIQGHPAPVVAAVEGAAVGAGLLIAASADILVISRTAVLGMPEVRLGIDSDPAALRRFLPDPWIRRMCLSGETFMAADLSLDSYAGAVVCEPGTTEQATAAIFGSLSGIDAAFLARAKRRLASQLQHQC